MRTVFGRKGKRAVSAVIGTILMVAVTVALAAVLYVMVSGSTPSNTAKPPTAQLQTGAWGGNTTTATYGVVVGSVQDVGGIQPSTLKFIVAKADNSPCYAGASGLNQSTCTGFNVSVRYQDTTSPGNISAGDSVLVMVTPATANPLQAGRLTIQTSDDKVLGTVTLS